MNGRLVGGVIVLSALAAGAAIWWLQVYAYYTEIASDQPGAEVRLVSIVTGAPEVVPASEFRGIDADSSPLRFRSCFVLPNSLAMLTETYVAAEKAVPLNGPEWFDCYDAAAIGAALESGQALAFLSEKNIHRGVDRIVAVYSDGRAYAWHQLNGEAE